MSNAEWKQYPRDIELDTPLGVVVLAVTDGDHIFVDAKHVTVNRVEYNASLHVFRQADGTFASNKHSDLYMSRVDNFKDASRAARIKTRVVLEGAVDAWARANADVFKAAADADTNNKVLRIDAELEELHAKINALVAQKLELLKGVA